MKKTLIVLVLIQLFGFVAIAQKNAAGVIKYEIKHDWIKGLDKVNYFSKEEKDRESNTWKNFNEGKEKMVLTFTPNKTYYTYGVSDELQSWGSNNELIVTRDFENNIILELRETLAKKYIISDSLRAPKWKILNDIKEVAGFICMKASSYDPIQNQTWEAWFSTEIPVSGGPERAMGLPGMILEFIIDDGVKVITATEIIFNADQELPALPKRQKGKKVVESEMNELIATYLKQQEAMHRMPWSLRY